MAAWDSQWYGRKPCRSQTHAHQSIRMATRVNHSPGHRTTALVRRRPAQPGPVHRLCRLRIPGGPPSPARAPGRYPSLANATQNPDMAPSTHMAPGGFPAQAGLTNRQGATYWSHGRVDARPKEEAGPAGKRGAGTGRKGEDDGSKVFGVATRGDGARWGPSRPTAGPGRGA